MSTKAVSSNKKLAQCVSSVLTTLLVGGVVFGFTALKPVLLAEGVYADACEDFAPCVEQDLKINFIFTAAATATNCVALPVGAMLDYFGPRKTSMLGAVLTIVSNLVFGWKEAPFDNYVVGYTLLSIAGPLVFLPCFQLSNAFPARSGLILSAVTGAFDASSLPYTIYREIYNRTGLGIKPFFWSYSLIGVAILVQQVFLGQDEPYEDASSNSSSNDAPADEQTALLRDDRPATKRPGMQRGNTSGMRRSFKHKMPAQETQQQDQDENKDPLNGMLQDKSMRQQIFSTYFLVLLLFVCITMTRVNFYVETTAEQLYHYTHDSELTSKLLTAFVWLLPLGGLVAIPFSGQLLDRTSSFTAFLVLGLFGALFGLTGLSSNKWLQLFNIAVFVVHRPLFYTAMSDYAAKTFGFATFGTVYGLINTLAGVFNLIQWPMDVLVKYRLHGNFTPVNLALVVSGVVTVALVALRIYTGVKNKTARQADANQRA